MVNTFTLFHRQVSQSRVRGLVLFDEWIEKTSHTSPHVVTLQGTNISPKNGILKMIFLFPKVGYVNFLEGI